MNFPSTDRPSLPDRTAHPSGSPFGRGALHPAKRHWPRRDPPGPNPKPPQTIPHHRPRAEKSPVPDLSLGSRDILMNLQGIYNTEKCFFSFFSEYFRKPFPGDSFSSPATVKKLPPPGEDRSFSHHFGMDAGFPLQTTHTPPVQFRRHGRGTVAGYGILP